MRYITIHDTGNTAKGAGAKNHASYIKGISAAAIPVSWHYSVDDKEIYQHLPEDETAYHAGDGTGSGNTASIGIEICINRDGDIMMATVNAAALAADIAARRYIPIENIVQHNYWSKKNCPQMLRSGIPFKWNEFIERVIVRMRDIEGVEDDTLTEYIIGGLILKGYIRTPEYWHEVLTKDEYGQGIRSGHVQVKKEYLQILLKRVVDSGGKFEGTFTS